MAANASGNDTYTNCMLSIHQDRYHHLAQECETLCRSNNELETKVIAENQQYVLNKKQERKSIKQLAMLLINNINFATTVHQVTHADCIRQLIRANNKNLQLLERELLPRLKGMLHAHYKTFASASVPLQTAKNEAFYAVLVTSENRDNDANSQNYESLQATYENKRQAYHHLNRLLKDVNNKQGVRLLRHDEIEKMKECVDDQNTLLAKIYQNQRLLDAPHICEQMQTCMNQLEEHYDHLKRYYDAQARFVLEKSFNVQEDEPLSFAKSPFLVHKAMNTPVPDADMECQCYQACKC